MMDAILQAFEQMTLWQGALILLLVLLIWFLPAMLAAVFNPRHAKIIAVACVPAGFSLIAWSALMVWAFTGKVWDKYAPKVKQAELEKTS